LLSSQGKLAEAAKRYEQAIQLQPSDRHLWANLGSVLRKVGDESRLRLAYQEATRLVDDALRVNPKDSELLADRAHYLGSLDENIRALQDVEQALRLEPKNPATLALLAETCARAGKEEDAIDLAKRALKLGYSITSFKEDWTLSRLIVTQEYVAEFEEFRVARDKDPDQPR